MMRNDSDNEPAATPGVADSTPNHVGAAPNVIVDFMQPLKHSRFIKIIIGEEDDEPYLVPEHVLVNSSPYFRKAIENEQRMGGESGMLRFPEDGGMLSAWGLMLYWIFNKSLPLQFDDDCYYIILFVECWTLADKYLLPKLQNALMMELISEFDCMSLRADPTEVNRLLRISPVDTPLRRLLSEETIYLIYGPKRIQSSDLIASDGVTGLSGSLLEALHAYKTNGAFYRLEDADGFKIEAFKEYLVSED